MKFFISRLYWLAFSVVYMSCNNASQQNESTSERMKPDVSKGTYAYDAEFLKKHTPGVIELKSSDGNSKVLLSAAYQGRVMTSTATGDSGSSYGWLNYDLISAREKKKQFNPVGGEERFWMGPEGGQYSIYFKGKDSFAFANWQVPSFIDTETYSVKESGTSEVVFSKKVSFNNWSGTKFDIGIERKINLLDKAGAESKLNVSIPADVQFVGYETVNKVENQGAVDWTKDKGLLSIWLLGMFTPSPKTVVVIPFHGGPSSRSYITDNYFGQIPPERLKVKDSVLYFTCDGKFRSKIGLSPLIAKPIAGSFDFEKNILTILIPQVNKDASYVNSKWELQKEPYKGDVINSYNDGPLADGTQMGPFYEIESSSSALQLNKGQSGEYKQSTFHFQGNYNSLKQLAQQLLGVNLDEIKR
ncbi:MAG: hypothetical protein JSS70_16665 [Bacteroidetes bacterium]|nr:hypothetical protein [Bacteroidota bacterium]